MPALPQVPFAPANSSELWTALYLTGHSEFESLHLAHTAVRHKSPKPEFAKTFNVKVWNSATWIMQKRVSGTQKLDGFFASFRREVGRKPFNTSGPTLESADKMEQHLHERMRCFQLAFWLSGNDLFQVFGALRAAELAAGASWKYFGVLGHSSLARIQAALWGILCTLPLHARRRAPYFLRRLLIMRSATRGC